MGQANVLIHHISVRISHHPIKVEKAPPLPTPPNVTPSPRPPSVIPAKPAIHPSPSRPPHAPSSSFRRKPQPIPHTHDHHAPHQSPPRKRGATPDPPARHSCPPPSPPPRHPSQTRNPRPTITTTTPPLPVSPAKAGGHASSNLPSVIPPKSAIHPRAPAPHPSPRHPSQTRNPSPLSRPPRPPLVIPPKPAIHRPTVTTPLSLPVSPAIAGTHPPPSRPPHHPLRHSGGSRNPCPLTVSPPTGIH